jgi:hypothetical protein
MTTTEMQSSATSAKIIEGTGDDDSAISIMVGRLGVACPSACVVDGFGRWMDSRLAAAAVMSQDPCKRNGWNGDRGSGCLSSALSAGFRRPSGSRHKRLIERSNAPSDEALIISPLHPLALKPRALGLRRFRRITG